jgi:outer membrane receptor protein involved in Fe transport
MLGQSQDFAVVTGSIYINASETAPFATVMVINEIDSQMVKADASNDQGQFNINGLPQGRYQLQISYVGFNDYLSEVFELSAGQTKEFGALQLSADAEALDEVVVKAKRPMIEIKPDKTIFNVAGSINAQGGNALELLRKAPGVILDNNESIMLLGKSGVMVYIDGKPSPLSSEDLANYLKGLSASTIDNIEVITNPSSKYEAEGNAGIINIVLKKAQNIGTHVSLNTGLATAKHTSYDAGLQINNRGKNANIFGGYNFANNENEQFMDLKRTIGSTFYDQQAKIIEDRKSHNAKIGVDYFINDQSTFGVLVNGFFMDGQNNNNSHSEIYLNKSLNVLDQILNAQNIVKDDKQNSNFNLNYAFKSKNGKSLNIDADYGTFRNTAISNQPNNYLDGQTNQLIRSVNFASDAKTDIDIYAFKVDAEQPFIKGILGYGIKMALVKTDNDYLFFDVDDAGNRTIDTERSNRFLYDENVNAAYVNFQRGNDIWNYQLGLRVEHTNSTGELITMTGNENQKNKKDYLDFFPTGGITYNANLKNTLRLSYSRRLNRPNYQDLNPFEFKLDELSFLKGNPFLNPEYTHNFQLGHTYNYSLNTTLSYSRTEDLITRLTDSEDGRQSFLTWENLSSQDALSLTVSYPFSLTDWLSTYLNVSGNYINNQSKAGDSRFTEDKRVDVEATFVSIFGQNTIQLPKDFNMEISGFYNSPGIWGGNFKTQEYWNVDIGIQKKFIDDRLNIRVGVSDVFRGQVWEIENEFGTLQLLGRGGRESRRFKVNLSYNFGNDKIKTRRRNTGLEEEKRRTSSSGGL